MEITVENLLDGPNTVRLFRNYYLKDAIANGTAVQANFDDVEEENKIGGDGTYMSTFNDFINTGNYNIGAVKLIMPERCITQQEDGVPVIYFCSWDINTATERKEILFNKTLPTGEFVATTDFILNIKAQIGIKFTCKGKITLFFAPAQRVDMSRGFRYAPLVEEFARPDFLTPIINQNP